MSKRSGSSRTREERVAAGRPKREFALPTEIDEEISALAEALGMSRSQVVSSAIEAFSVQVAGKPKKAP